MNVVIECHPYDVQAGRHGGVYGQIKQHVCLWSYHDSSQNNSDDWYGIMWRVTTWLAAAHAPNAVVP